MKYGVLVPAGPGDREIARILDLLDALACHDPEDCAVVLILNDRNPRIAELAAASARVRVLDNPRNGEGWGWAGGLIGGQLWAWELIAREYGDLGCFVKMDSDAISLRPLGAPLAAIFADPKVGAAGARIDDQPYPPYRQAAPFTSLQRRVRKVRAPLSLWRLPRWHVRQAVFGHHRWVAGLFTQAEKNGYLPGELIMGGALAFSVECARRMVDLGITQRWRDFLDLAISDDYILTMLPYLGGLRSADAPLFCVEPENVRFPPADLLRDPAVGVVHSVKGHGKMTEEEIRAQFRANRHRPS
jgi:hypothetical protein